MNKNTLNRHEIPLSYNLPVFDFFNWKRIKLKSGINLLMIEDNTQPLVTMKVLIKRGVALEKLPGVANLTAKMLTKGTKKMSAKQIAGEYEHYGISFSSTGRWDDTYIQFISLAEHYNKGASILFDCLLNSIFPEKETEKLKTQQISSIMQNWFDPSFIARAIFSSTYFGDHPYGRTISGLSDDVEAINSELLINWHKELLNSSEIFIVLAGNFNEKDATSLIESELQGISFNRITDTFIDLPKVHTDQPVAIIEKVGAQQTSLRLGKPSINRENPDFPLYQLANTIFGGYFKSRLNNLIREKLGYTYGISSANDTRLYGNNLVIGADLNTKSTKDAIEKILEQLGLFSSEKITAEEHSTAIQYITGAFVRMLETPQQKAGILAGAELFSLPDNFYQSFLDRIREATIEEVFEVQQKYFKPENIVIACCGDMAYLQNELKDIGNIRIVSNPEI